MYLEKLIEPRNSKLISMGLNQFLFPSIKYRWKNSFKLYVIEAWKNNREFTATRIIPERREGVRLHASEIRAIRFRPRLKREMRCSEIFGIRLFAREMKRNDHFPAEWISSFELNEN